MVSLIPNLDHIYTIESNTSYLNKWPIGKSKINISGNISINDGEMIKELVLAGTGIGIFPDFMVQSYLDSSKLIELFKDQATFSGDLAFLYPANRNFIEPVRIFMNFFFDKLKK